ncbi:hypothetical protein HHK36_029058 [Tetracentron sinense]|uniref:Glycoside hydrolase family 5 domain-containing protein n=1 Tax=Tetracentron sinense TaxID=13715 RepID=A0A835D101_TETSI|nr:hypothetical protein HHK36_029058 [Tetracentron sinense]
MIWRALDTIFLVTLMLFGSLGDSLPLATSTRWIVDAASGHRVKLSCVNWAAHMQAMVAEGLDKRPLKEIAARVASLGFNCVRLTWATFMFTRKHYANITVAQSLDSLGLREASTGIAENDHWLLNLTLVEAYEAVVNELGAQNLMVVLDNHVSKPQWCCGNDDGNGFFGDMYFDPEEWLQGLTIVAKRFKGKPQVVGMSMRNELRGPRQNKQDWYRYIQRGARKIHKANPNVLVIVSGLNYDTDLSFLGRKPLGIDLDNKLVYEAHWYSFSGQQGEWEVQPLNWVCANATRRIDERVGFVTQGENPVPLFVSEFGVDQRGVNQADNQFLSCFLAFATERDLDWAIWALQGSYYLRNGQAGFEETYGVLDIGWDHPRNPKFQERFGLIQEMIQDPSLLVSTYYIMYHPQSGRCVQVKGKDGLRASYCRKWSRWIHNGEGTPIRLMNTALCLKVVGDGLPVTLSTDCSGKQSTWKSVSSSNLQIAAMDEQGRYLCLEKSSSNSTTILTKKCLCLDDDSNCYVNPQTQWFKLIPSNLN